MDWIKKNWIFLFGILFVFAAFASLFDVIIDASWLTDGVKIGAGILISAAFTIGGMKLQPKSNVFGQLLTGLGVALFYATFTFASIYYAIWSPYTAFFGFIAVTVAVAIYSLTHDLRTLMNISLLGALLSPIILKSHGDQVFTLFLYLLVINAVFFFLSVKKSWLELRVISFIGTWILYSLYYLHIDPEGVERPLAYLLSAYGFYVIAFILSSYKEQCRFDGVNLYLNVANAVLFALWMFPISDEGNFDIAFCFMGMGCLYLAASWLVFKWTNDHSFSGWVHFYGGLLLLLMAGSSYADGSAFEGIINTYVWLFVSAVLLVIGIIRHIDTLKWVSVGLWAFSGVYWFETAFNYSTPTGIWFGTFIPLLNANGMAWVFLAGVGFFLSLRFKVQRSPLDGDVLSVVFAVVSHLIVGGLLYFQVVGLWTHYPEMLTDISESLAVSISWTFYAFLLYIWAAYHQQGIFRVFGGAVLALVAVKTFITDIWSGDGLFKFISLLVIGLLFIICAVVRQKYTKNTQS
jgi:uncharacterized membrane protein